MKKVLITILILAVLGAVAYAAMSREDGPLGPAVSLGNGVKAYSSRDYGISFEYPDKYYLEEANLDTAQRARHEIALTEDTEWNRKLRSGDVPPTEGPTSITIGIFQNDLDKQSARGFVTGSNDSNYKLGDGNISTTTRGTLEGMEYTWSGLYEGRSFVVARPDYIYMFSVTRLDPTDKILQDFNEILETVKIE